MRRLVKKLCTEKDAMMQCQMHAVNITTYIKVKIDFTLPALSATDGVVWKLYVDDSARTRDSTSSTLDLFEFRMSLFDHGNPEEFLLLVWDSQTTLAATLF